MNSNNIISSDEDPGLRIESFAIIKIHGVSTEYKLCYIFCHANVQRLYLLCAFGNLPNIFLICQTIFITIYRHIVLKIFVFSSHQT